MMLYHYTSLEHLAQILEDREIHLTASNLLKPIAPHIVNGNFVDETDSYKPVVWFTSVMDFGRAKGAGLDGSILDKTAAAIAVDSTSQNFVKWETWAKRNRIETSWFNALKRTAPLWETFYITEQPVPITNDTRIIFRPDIQQKLQQTPQKEGE